MAERCHANPRHEVEVLASVHVEQPGARAAHEGDGLPPVGLDDVASFTCFDVVECLCHRLCHRTTCVHPAIGPLAATSASRAHAATIGDQYVADALAHRLSARLQFCNHPLVGCPRPDHPSGGLRVEARDRLAGGVEHARRAPGDHQAPRAERGGQVRGERVGVHVEQLPGARRADARHDRHVSARDEVGEQLRRAVGRRRADQPQVHLLAGDARDRRRPPHRGDRCIRAREPHGSGPRLPERGDQARIDRARDHRDDDVERAGIGDAQPVHLVLLDARRSQTRVDFPPAAVHHDQRRAARQRGNPARDAIEVSGLFEQFASQLEDEPRPGHQSRPVRSSRPRTRLRF